MNGRPSFEPYDFLGRLKRDEIFVPIIVYGHGQGRRGQ